MKTFITLITFIGLVLAEPGKPLSSQKRNIGEKEIVASVQVRIIIPDRYKNLKKHNSVDWDSLRDKRLKPANPHYMVEKNVGIDKKK